MTDPTGPNGILEIYKQIAGAGVPFLLFALLWLLSKKFIVFGYQLAESKAEGEQLKAEKAQLLVILLRNYQHTDKALDVGAAGLNVVKSITGGG